MARAFILLLDSLGIGACQDAAQYGDTGANTLGHIAQYCAEGKCDTNKRQGNLQLPTLSRLGLGMAALASTGQLPAGLTANLSQKAAFGYAIPQSRVKDRPTGHWEIAGIPTFTENHRDLATAPPEPTLLDHMKSAGGEVIAVGKTVDIFAQQGMTQKIKADGNLKLFNATLKLAHNAPDHSLIFTNFGDFDSLYGQPDATRYAAALEELDAQLHLFEAALKPNDIAIITANHGCDPTHRGSDHTREHIPILVLGLNNTPKFLGRRETFADIGQSIAQYLQIEPLPYGVAFL